MLPAISEGVRKKDVGLLKAILELENKTVDNIQKKICQLIFLPIIFSIEAISNTLMPIKAMHN